MLKPATLAAILFLSFSPAQAAVMQATWTGTILSGYDGTATWGPGSTDLTGVGYTMTFLYDTSLGIRTTSPGQFDQVYGGSDYPGGATDPVLSATMTIRGQTQSGTGANQGYLYTQDAALGGNVFQNIAYDFASQPNGSFVYHYMYGLFDDLMQAGSPVTPSSLDTPFTGTVPGSALCASSGAYCGWFQFADYNAALGAYTTYSWATFGVDSLTVRALPVAPVPLPAGAATLLAAIAILVGLRSARARRPEPGA
ncbi:MAG: hypothetical protein ACKVPY_16890 [Paracoccaceae bacterium]